MLQSHFESVSFRFCVTGDASAADALRHLYEACAIPPGDDADEVAIGARPDRNAELIAAAGVIDRCAVERSCTELILLHASLVIGPDGPVVLVGPGGAGKSTLAAALTANGWTYAGDEVIGVVPGHGSLIANPRPWKLDARARRVLAPYVPSARAVAACAEETLVAPGDVGACVAPGALGRPAAIVHIAFREGSPVKLEPVSRADMVQMLASQCYNFSQWGSTALDTMIDIVTTARRERLMFGAPDAVLGAFGEGAR